MATTVELLAAYNAGTIQSTGRRKWAYRTLADAVRRKTKRRCCTSTVWRVINGYILRGPRYRAICEILGVEP